MGDIDVKGAHLLVTAESTETSGELKDHPDARKDEDVHHRELDDMDVPQSLEFLDVEQGPNLEPSIIDNKSVSKKDQHCKAHDCRNNVPLSAIRC
eukprot:m.99803 g.99803  ORF g.99803 m.99803 type:complete len:95 (+) comp12471_c0_seq3:637-921(+)